MDLSANIRGRLSPGTDFHRREMLTADSCGDSRGLAARHRRPALGLSHLIAEAVSTATAPS